MEFKTYVLGICRKDGREVLLLEHGLTAEDNRLVEMARRAAKETGRYLPTFNWRNGAWYEDVGDSDGG